ncbi:MAG: HAD-IA family hydrolase [Bacteroidetes bacterium]|nr:HAD-IA family hydrolase [Bacteroidota bacterium]
MTAHQQFPFRCFVFDMDGTLVQTNQLIFDSFNHVANKFTNTTYSNEEIIALFGPPEDHVIRILVGNDNAYAAMEEYLQFYRKEHRFRAKLHDGIHHVLHALKTGGKLVTVFTGKCRATTKITLEECGLQQYFDLIITGDDVQYHKPSSEGLQKIMNYFSLMPQEVLMIGDSPADVHAARSAGVTIAAVLWDSYAKETMLSLHTDFTFHNVHEFQEWLFHYVL